MPCTAFLARTCDPIDRHAGFAFQQCGIVFMHSLRNDVRVLRVTGSTCFINLIETFALLILVFTCFLNPSFSAQEHSIWPNKRRTSYTLRHAAQCITLLYSTFHHSIHMLYMRRRHCKKMQGMHIIHTLHTLNTPHKWYKQHKFNALHTQIKEMTHITCIIWITCIRCIIHITCVSSITFLASVCARASPALHVSPCASRLPKIEITVLNWWVLTVHCTLLHTYMHKLHSLTFHTIQYSENHIILCHTIS